MRNIQVRTEELMRSVSKQCKMEKNLLLLKNGAQGDDICLILVIPPNIEFIQSNAYLKILEEVIK